MIFRYEILKAYWMIAYERQNIFFNKIEGNNIGSKDIVLNKYKFTNSYRASDRVSQYLIKNVIYTDNYKEENILFRILLFKIFNKIETWEFLQSKMENININNFNVYDTSEWLEEMNKTEPIWTSAYMTYAGKSNDRKHLMFLKIIDDLIECKTLKLLINSNSLESLYYKLLSIPGLGKFMSYQLATDFNYSEVFNFDENDFTMAGVGAVRGINKVVENLEGSSLSDVIFYMVYNQERLLDQFGFNDFKTLWGRKLKAIDCQNLFCEVDKYCRVAYPALESNRVKIKTCYVSNEPKHGKIKYFYPPKWLINGRVDMMYRKLEKTTK